MLMLLNDLQQDHNQWDYFFLIILLKDETSYKKSPWQLCIDFVQSFFRPVPNKIYYRADIGNSKAFCSFRCTSSYKESFIHHTSLHAKKHYHFFRHEKDPNNESKTNFCRKVVLLHGIFPQESYIWCIFSVSWFLVCVHLLLFTVKLKVHNGFGVLEQKQDACLCRRSRWEIWVNQHLHSASLHCKKKKKIKSIFKPLLLICAFHFISVFHKKTESTVTL